MKHFLPILALSVLCACGSKHEKTDSRQNAKLSHDHTISANPELDENVEDKATGKGFPDWEKHQDSLRREILNGKKNRLLKESFLQEMYIRNVATISGDSVTVNIPFDLHGPDCGAPDCYVTNVRFSLKSGVTLSFPKTLHFVEREQGCVDREQQISGDFKLLEQSDSHVIYYAEKHKRTLVLFRSYKENGTTAFYFTGLGAKRITGQNVNSILNEYDDEDNNAIYPFRSWVLTTNDYAYFMH